MSEYTISDLSADFASLLNCCLHNPVWTPQEVSRILFIVNDESRNYSTTGKARWAEGPKSGTESESITVVQLLDGGYGVFEESEDYTGHGCQCSSRTSRHDTLTDLLSMGIDQYDRDAIREHLIDKGEF